MHNIHENVSVSAALTPQAITTDTTTAGAIIDKQSAHHVEFVILSATLTDGTYTPLIEEGDAANLSDAAAVADADLDGTEAGAVFAATDDDTAKRIGYSGRKRYVRLSLVSASTTSGGTLGAVAVVSTRSRAVAQ